ncbi:unnamed protein product [Somion occarium]|uniref:Pali-domain-containing protein n=1 Tax=Somion occarium TaxID=3059160 RepID=A0ABP1CEQ7_9APHY
MGWLRPATPGFLVTLAATILLALVTFSAPFLKSIYFLKASLNQENIGGNIVFGTFGYCFELGNGTTCSKPSVGYQLGNDLPIQIPSVIVKWITYALFLHAVALILAAISAAFGLLAHVREFTMTCCSTCVSGFAAAVAMLAFIFDIAFFFLAKARINAIPGGSASIGIGLWLTLAAWICLFFAGCFYGFGRCCISRRPRDEDKRRNKPSVEDGYAERVRMDAIKAEADRKARQAKGEVGLPAFQEYEHQPLTKGDPEEYADDGHQVLPYNGQAGIGAGTAAYARQGASPPANSQSGYAQAPAGTRAVDDYYNSRPNQGNNSYPPQPHRQASGHTVTSSGYTPSVYSTTPAPPIPTIPPPVSTAAVGAAAGAGYLSAGGQYGHDQYPSAASGAAYGHTAGGTTYHSAATHQQYPSAYSAYADPYGQANPVVNTETYNSTGYMGGMTSPHAQSPSSAYPANPQSPPPQNASYYTPQRQNTYPERSYTLGGDGYGSNVIPNHTQGEYDPYSAYYPQQTSTPPMPAPTPPSINTDVQRSGGVASSPRGPRPPSGTMTLPTGIPEQPQYEDSPPMYDAATSQPPGAWGTKH